MSEASPEQGIDIDAKGVMKMIPHRFPFLMIDRVENAVADKGCVGIKNVSMNEAIFQGHFPADPVFPGVLIIEAMAQIGAVGVMAGGEHADKLALFAGIDGVRFRRQVVPGDVLNMEVEIDRLKGRVGRGTGRAAVRGERVCEAQLMFAFAERGGVE
jgi:3-hydroxyacyl-[acyl-carrier-protein] dehydratase